MEADSGHGGLQQHWVLVDRQANSMQALRLAKSQVHAHCIAWWWKVYLLHSFMLSAFIFMTSKVLWLKSPRFMGLARCVDGAPEKVSLPLLGEVATRPDTDVPLLDCRHSSRQNNTLHNMLFNHRGRHTGTCRSGMHAKKTRGGGGTHCDMREGIFAVHTCKRFLMADPHPQAWLVSKQSC